jgi:hypothetical protein
MTPHDTPTRAGRRSPRVAVAGVGALSLLAGLLAAGSLPATAADTPSPLLTASATWRYSENNTDPAAGNPDRLVWTYAGYDDSAWKSASGPFGAKSGSATPSLGSGFPVSTVLNQYIDPTATSKVDVPTMHFRSSFNVDPADLAGLSGLTGTVVYDDAVQIFVNGAKVAGFVDDRVESVPDSEKNLTYAGESGGNPVTSTFTVPTAALHGGTNTIAIALYQDRPTSSDLYLNLVSLVPTPVTEPSPSITDLVLGVGADETQRNVAWYSSADTAQVVQVAPAADLVNGEFPSSAASFAASGGAATSGETYRHATVTGLVENTVYAYRVGSADGWSATQSFRTRAFDSAFEAIVVGDPQIGASGNVGYDQAGWADTLGVAQAAYPQAEMIISAGDQVDSAGNETQYTAFLAPDQLRSIPLATTIGNHDVGSKAYEQHFNVPNGDPSAGAASSGSSSGGDYWYMYKDVLFVGLNSNSRDYASHNEFLRRVVAEQGARAKWKVLTFHHSIYSTASHANDSDIVDRRNSMPQVISELGFDLVLQGHDHVYTRSYLVKDGAIADGTEVAGQAQVAAKPGEVLYVTANSASGSKFYNVTVPDAWFASVINQERVRNYSVLSVTDQALTVSTMRSQANGDKQVNSLVDQVVLAHAVDPNAQDLQVAVPEATPGELVWNVDGTNGLVDLGTAVERGDHFEALGTMNPVRVTDTRKSGPQWSISARVSDFVSDDSQFSGGYLAWTPAVVEAGAGAVAGAPVASTLDGGPGLAASATLGSAAAQHAKGSAKLGADLALKVPVEVATGTYRATLTLTALS